MARQMAITEICGEKKPNLKTNFYNTKYSFRSGIIDIHKRFIIMKYFDIKSTKCFIDY